MARFSVHMTFEAPAQRTPSSGSVVARLPRGGSARYVAGDGTIAVTAVVRADTAAEAALQLCGVVERQEATRGRGPVRLVSWRATRSVPVLAGLGRRRAWQGGGGSLPRPGSGDGDDGGDEGGGTAGVREPRRPRPSPGALSAEADPPHQVRGRHPG